MDIENDEELQQAINASFENNLTNNFTEKKVISKTTRTKLLHKKNKMLNNNNNKGLLDTDSEDSDSNDEYNINEIKTNISDNESDENESDENESDENESDENESENNMSRQNNNNNRLNNTFNNNNSNEDSSDDDIDNNNLNANLSDDLQLLSNDNETSNNEDFEFVNINEEIIDSDEDDNNLIYHTQLKKALELSKDTYKNDNASSLFDNQIEEAKQMSKQSYKEEMKHNIENNIETAIIESKKEYLKQLKKKIIIKEHIMPLSSMPINMYNKYKKYEDASDYIFIPNKYRTKIISKNYEHNILNIRLKDVNISEIYGICKYYIDDDIIYVSSDIYNQILLNYPEIDYSSIFDIELVNKKHIGVCNEVVLKPLDPIFKEIKDKKKCISCILGKKILYLKKKIRIFSLEKKKYVNFKVLKTNPGNKYLNLTSRNVEIWMAYR